MNDAIAIHFLDTAGAAAFAARWCADRKPEIMVGAFRLRDDASEPRRPRFAFLLLRLAGVLTDMAARMAPIEQSR